MSRSVGLAGLAAAAVDITSLNRNVSTTSRTGAVSAAGTLEPFGGVGVGCGINWAEGESYGEKWQKLMRRLANVVLTGGLQSGSESFGLGGGFTITEKTMTIGLAIGVHGPLNFNTTPTSVDYEASTNGSASVIFTSTKEIKCKETTVNGLKGFRCTSA
ncbi:hypothetical protein CTA2_1168 [Colletotrichum tanaceti]|uniref:Uncharacterized protein n=1 Tax=Colletotrichum tanaceti TaxID=1306861 RepID=A0A4U6XSQ5_9PEZI|nr:hypothetical protein CTA2_1167 [Colletotrichum tanaceti]KAJ0164370.1 hypothetical protein CTA2_1168 [Colletotrichum tanaceti]TKW58963.1 hypothetical protein CTA1_1635 [Colletotrichum tanaceti]